MYANSLIINTAHTRMTMASILSKPHTGLSCICLEKTVGYIILPATTHPATPYNSRFADLCFNKSSRTVNKTVL